MTDIFSKSKRSEIMSKVKGFNTKPEMIVRSLIHRNGYRYSLHRKELPGTPDIVLRKHRKIVFVHGCFWHGHEKCPRSSLPSTNRQFWKKKISGNIVRDKHINKLLRKTGWSVLVVWECEIKKLDRLEKRVIKFLSNH